jgi:spore coat polysaccharide biosynthesis protein SpsF
VRTLCVVQARTGSTRLPGKVLADVGGRPMLGLMLDRLARLDVDALVVATSDLDQDDPVAQLAADRHVAVVRGPEQDVLGRFARALEQHPADLVVRLTADCPFADPDVITAAIALARRSGADYTSNSLVRTFPDGLDTEAVTATALTEAHAEAVDSREREHVTPFVYRRTSRYRLAALRNDELLGNERWTVDTAADLERIRAMAAAVSDPVAAGWRQILTVAGRHGDPAPGALHLRPATEADALPRVLPFDDPSTRTWVVERDAQAVGWAEVVALDGDGTATIEVPATEQARTETLLRAALTDDLQIERLVVEG